MTKEFKAIKKEGGCIIHVAVLWSDPDKEEMEQKERRLAELVLTAALRKWKREKSFFTTQNSSQNKGNPIL